MVFSIKQPKYVFTDEPDHVRGKVNRPRETGLFVAIIRTANEFDFEKANPIVAAVMRLFHRYLASAAQPQPNGALE